jgi:aspartate carbamoyltransferase regulatory subunit
MQFLVNYIQNGVRYYKCSLCGKTTNNKSNIQRHMVLVHTKPTNDVCKYCQRVFKHRYYLDEHIRTRACLSNMLFDAPSSSTQ